MLVENAKGAKQRIRQFKELAVTGEEVSFPSRPSREAIDFIKLSRLTVLAVSKFEFFWRGCAKRLLRRVENAVDGLRHGRAPSKSQSGFVCLVAVFSANFGGKPTLAVREI